MLKKSGFHSFPKGHMENHKQADEYKSGIEFAKENTEKHDQQAVACIEKAYVILCVRDDEKAIGIV